MTSESLGSKNSIVELILDIENVRYGLGGIREHVHNKSASSIAYSDANNVNVEDRLYTMNNLYKQRREKKLRDAEEKLKQNYKNPEINKFSEKLLKEKADRRGKIEDRLFMLAKKQKKDHLDESKSMKSQSSVKSFKGNHNSTAVIGRLLDYGNLYKQKRLEKEQRK